MSQLIVIKERLRVIRNLRKVTRAMELVTQTKINKVRLNGVNAKNYYELIQDLFLTVKNAGAADYSAKPTKDKPYKVIISIFSQKGFCGAFNDKLMSYLNEVLHTINPDQLILIGKKNSKWNWLSKNTTYQHLSCREKNYQQEIYPELKKITELILNAQPVELYLVFNEYKTVLEQRPKLLQVYPPLEKKVIKKDAMLFEPGQPALFQALLSSYLDACFERVYWESMAGEYCARLLSMKNANDNAAIILDKLQILFNKTRQLKINQELSEIVSAFDVLKIIQEKKTEQEEVY